MSFFVPVVSSLISSPFSGVGDEKTRGSKWKSGMASDFQTRSEIDHSIANKKTGERGKALRTLQVLFLSTLIQFANRRLQLPHNQQNILRSGYHSKLFFPLLQDGDHAK